jgi:hypothetical protein
MLAYCRPGAEERQAYESQFETDIQNAAVVRYELGAMQNALGECKIYDGNAGEALPHLQAAYDAVRDGDGESATLRATVTIWLSIALVQSTQASAAHQLLQRESDTVSVGAQKQPRLGARLELALGFLSIADGNPREAAAHFLSAVGKFRDCLGDQNPEQIWPELLLVEAELQVGETDKARQHLNVVKSIIDKYYDPKSMLSTKSSELAKRV